MSPARKPMKNLNTRVKGAELAQPLKISKKKEPMPPARPPRTGPNSRPEIRQATVAMWIMVLPMGVGISMRRVVAA